MSEWSGARTRRLGETHEVLTAGTKGVPRNTRCNAAQGIEAVLACRGDVAADAAEVHESLDAAKGAGDLLAQLYHPQLQTS